VPALTQVHAVRMQAMPGVEQTGVPFSILQMLQPSLN
jgi:hypothetical protein